MEGDNPTTIVIFGATGDLFRKKLAPALFRLFTSGGLPKFFRVVAFARRPWSDLDFRKFLSEALLKEMPSSPQILNEFIERVRYVEGDFNSLPSYRKVAELLSEIDMETQVCANKLFYLATPPSFYEVILKSISDSGLSIPCAPVSDGASSGWTRILIEKPFGSDLKNARRLDLMLEKLFGEDKVFRVDHYVAKETVQNILTFRFANAIFEPVWNRKYIERVDVKIFEKKDVESRGNFYDGLGALLDMGQNHLLQLAALVAMDNPVEQSALALRKKRADALAKFRLWEGAGALAVRGQYEGYLKEEGISKDSTTETYFKVKLALPNKRFKGVPFTLEHGKALSESKVEISVCFKQAAEGMCPAGICPYPGNAITFRIQPNETISLLYWAKKPGIDFLLEPRELVLARGESANTDALGAYGRILVDAIRGDQTLFTSTDEVMAEWKIVRDIIKKWNGSELVKYKKGTMPVSND
jgi:glucose-6-phosphate 1-dehydrogenase